MNQQRFSLLLAVAFGFLFGIVVMTARQPQPDRFRMDLPHAAIALVDRAHGLVSDDDLAGFETMDFAPSFNQGDMYIFVLAADGVNLYHAADRTLVGTDFSRLSMSPDAPLVGAWSRMCRPTGCGMPGNGTIRSAASANGN